MNEENPSGKDRQILEGWKLISSDVRIGALNEQEEQQFEKARFAEEQAQKTNFVLGIPIKRSL